MATKSKCSPAESAVCVVGFVLLTEVLMVFMSRLLPTMSRALPPASIVLRYSWLLLDFCLFLPHCNLYQDAATLE